MPGAGKTSQAVVATRCLEDSLHASIIMNNRPESLQDDRRGEANAIIARDYQPIWRIRSRIRPL
jgi:hypothetical protein